MNTNDPRFELIRRCRDGEASAEELVQFEAILREDADFRESYVRYTNIDLALSTASIMEPVLPGPSKNKPDRLYYGPIMGAAAGLVFGMFCTSMVYGFVAQRAATKKMPLVVFDAGLEDEKQILKDGLPDHAGQWGMDSARVVAEEGRVKPLQGLRMMRLDPIPREKDVKNHTSRVYQVLDLRQMPVANMVGEVEVQVTASFFSTKSEASSRYLIRAIALDEAPEMAMKDFWSKTERDDVVSVSQRFDTTPGNPEWHTFSMKMPLPRGARTLVFILGAVPPEDASMQASVHYLDDVHVSLLTPAATLP